MRDRNQWRLAIHTLIEAAEDQGPVLFARVAMTRAIEHGEVCGSGVDREIGEISPCRLLLPKPNP
jgi:hypothetical protein